MVTEKTKLRGVQIMKKAIKIKSSVKTLMLEQQVRYGFTKELIHQFLYDGDDLWSAIKDYAYIEHDKDDGVESHCHLLLRFNGAQPVVSIIRRLVSVIDSKKAGIMMQDLYLQGFDFSTYFDYLNEIKTVMKKGIDDVQLLLIVVLLGKNFCQCSTIGSWSGSLNYLTHRDEPTKHTYDISEVITNVNYEVDSAEAHLNKRLKITKLRINEVVENISSGVWLERDLMNYMTAYEYVMLKSYINESLKIYYKRKVKEERNMEVVFITGSGGRGKDHFAMKTFKDRGKTVYRCNNSDNPFDDYCGEEVVVWSDARDNAMTPEKLFNLLDNKNNSRAKARYYDKTLCCETLVITSSKPLDQWYKKAFEDNKEGRVQLYRRISTYVVMGDDKVEIYALDRNKVLTIEDEVFDKFPYALVCELPNVYKMEEKKLTLEEQKGMLKELFGGLMDTVTYVEKNI